MRTEGDMIKINRWLLPFSWLYGIVVGLRNALFDMGILKSRAFDVPVISVGNITIGGAGKTPHVEYIIRLLHDKVKVAVLSRGYKRKSSGYILADADCTATDIGDEPCQMKRKFADIYVAVDKNRCHGIDRITTDQETSDTDVVLLDDAFQHRYVKPGVNILLVDYHRLIIYDTLLPAGRLRERQHGKSRADIVIVTKCPHDLNPMEYRVLTKAMGLYPFQKLYFTTIAYKPMYQLFGTENKALCDVDAGTSILLLTGIASPNQLISDLGKRFANITRLTFADHHRFSRRDIERINHTFGQMSGHKLLITTEKDAERLINIDGLSDEVRQSTYVLPISVEFMLGGGQTFDETILSYISKNSRRSILNLHKSGNSSAQNKKASKPHTISFRE